VAGVVRVAIGRALLRLAAPPSRVDEVLFELDDEHALIADRAAADRFYLVQALSSLAPLLLLRMRRQERSDRVAMAALAVMVVVVCGAHALADLVRSLVPLRDGRTPLTGVLVLTLAAAALVVGLASRRASFAYGALAAILVQPALSFTVAILPLWYRLAFFAVLPLTAVAVRSSFRRV
jgi:hypothetical protein